MSVYVDNYQGRLGRMIMCHMIADTRQELFGMAARLGLNPEWVQHHGTTKEHFDISLRKREQAVRMGAKEVGARDIVLKLQQRSLAAYLGGV